MANVGDLFINVRAKTSGLTKGLRSARRSLANFAKSGTGIIAGIGGAFGIFKTFQFLMGSLIGNSKEFREAWARVGIAINEAGAEFARQFGTSLAEGLDDLAKWVSESQALRDVIGGIGPLFTDVIIPAISGAYTALEPFRLGLAAIIEDIMGLPSKMDKLGEGISPEELERINKGTSGMTPRTMREVGEAMKGLDIDSIMGDEIKRLNGRGQDAAMQPAASMGDTNQNGITTGIKFGNSSEGQAFANDYWLKTIAQRVEVPK